MSDAAVIGLPDVRWGEVGHAVVCLNPGQSLSEKELLAFLEGKLARFKIPKSVSFANELPRNPAGKVLKRELRESYV